MSNSYPPLAGPPPGPARDSGYAIQAAPTQSGGIWGLWLRLTMPRPPHQAIMNASLRERLRRARLLSVLLLVTLLLALVLVPRGFFPVFDPGTTGGVALAFIIVVVGILLNRGNHVNAASTVFVLGIALAVALAQVAVPDGTLGLQDVSAFDLFALPIIIAGILLPRRVPVLIWLGASIFTVLDLLLLPHKANLDRYILESHFSNVYPIAVLPLVLTAVAAAVSSLAAGSVQQAISEADRTVDLERANQVIIDQNRRLEEGVAVIQNVHARVANGDLSVRAPVTSGELVSLAISLNLMLERLSRSMAAESTLGGLEQNVQQLGHAVAELAQGRLRYPIPQEGMGRLTPIAYNLEQLRAGILSVMRQCSAQAERIAQARQQMSATNRTLAQYAQHTFAPDTPATVRELPDRLARVDQELGQFVDQLNAYLARFGE